jgi:hypothetical protein
VTSQPAGIDCPSTCSASFSSGTLVTLMMSAGHWGGACTGWDSLSVPTGWVLHCRLVVDASTAVIVSDVPPPPVPPPPPPTARFDVTVSGKGLVTSADHMLGCGRSSSPRTRCQSYSWRGGKYVVLAGARRGTRFAKWGGSCRGTKTRCRISIPMGEWPNYALTALFRIKR